MQRESHIVKTRCREKVGGQFSMEVLLFWGFSSVVVVCLLTLYASSLSFVDTSQELSLLERN